MRLREGVDRHLRRAEACCMRVRCRCMEVRPAAEGAQLPESVESALGGVPSSCSAGDISRREGTTSSHVIACCL
jgi:hypothetical protein